MLYRKKKNSLFLEIYNLGLIELFETTEGG